MARARPRRILLAALTALAIAGTSGCTSPTLPLPPPETPFVSSGSELNTYKLSSVGGAEPNALIIVVNRDEELAPDKRVTGTIADARGSWSLVVTARPGDVLDISQESGSTRSPGTTITVR